MDLNKLQNKIQELNFQERQCTNFILEQYKNKPLHGTTILLNCHLTTATLLLVEIFLRYGAKLKITCTEELVCHPSILNLVTDLGLFISPRNLEEKKYNFDVVIDCGAFLANILHPKIAFIELTNADESKYININCPVISVDKSVIKQIETTYGTGDGFVRAIESVYAERGNNFKDKNYLVFGYGKVGKGICASLYQSGLSKKSITVVEINHFLQAEAMASGFKTACALKNQNDIVATLNNEINCAVTATGVTNCISSSFTPCNFKKVELLANMGTYDEWGSFFPNESILFKKRPLNFMLEYPTRILYLDPIFALLACATLDVVKEKNINKFSIQKPKLETEKEILNVWLKNNFKTHEGITESWINEKALET
jgi:S-adenosylhomocysteine hydrolase